MDPLIGKMLDNRYEILECIGTGGMAMVYKAKCHLLNRLVAIKILKSDLAQDADFRRRFNAESRAVAQLSHPNIVSVYDVSRGGNIDYIVMELIDGITLKQYMERRGQLNWRESLHFITQIMRGLSHAHSRGIIHRDIKPQNVMVLRDGSVKVADFGIACLESAAQTVTQETIGSVHYISPEQARGDRMDARSDIYSAGVVLYEMLTGRLPFEGESAVSVAIQHLSAIPLAPREINPDIPEQLELICMKAMAPELSRRYASADEMVADLEAFRRNPEINLDFELSDLRPKETDEPTMILHNPGRYTGAETQSQSERGEETAPGEKTAGDDDDDRRHRIMMWIRGILIAVVAITAVTVAVKLSQSIMDSFDTPPAEQFRVPSVVGMTVKEAEALDTVQGVFQITVAEEVFSDSYEAGQIIRQEPAANVNRKGENLVIQVWVSAGEDTGTMQDVRYLTVAQAKVQMQQLIRQYDLVFDYAAEYQQYSDEIPSGYIISTEPAAGDPLSRGDTVVLVVSKGPELHPVAVPVFVGQNIDTVLRQLDKLGLVCGVNDVAYVENDAPEGEIIWQSLAASTTAMEGDTIQFRVSSGPPKVITLTSVTETIELPQDGRETVFMEVYVGDAEEPQVRRTVYCSELAADVTLTGYDVQTIRVHFDGVPELSYPLQFN